MTEYYVIEPCTSANGIEIKLKGRKIDIKLAEKALSGMGASVLSGPVVLIAKLDDYSISVYGSGRMMVKTEKKIDNKKIEELARRIVGSLEKTGAIK
jgi:predicted ATP-grasp superfamily ATP-dependent carboligase